MGKRAEEAALKRFPEEMTRIPYQDLIEAFGGKEYVDFNSMPRGYFQLGYEQAEKDITEAALVLVDSVEKYVRQECSRSTLLSMKDNLKKLLEK